MTCPHPDRPVRARQMCTACYCRAWRDGTLPEIASVHRGGKTGRRWLQAGALPARILDLLEADGLPMTRFQIAAALNANDGSVHMALYRLSKRGLVQGEQSLRRGGGQPANRWSLAVADPAVQLETDRAGLRDAIRLSLERDRRAHESKAWIRSLEEARQVA